MATTSPMATNDDEPDALAGPYSLTALLQDIDLTHEKIPNPIITCVEYWEGNLYIGTSAGEVQHYVRIPGDASEADSFILASRQEPSPVEEPTGVKQILILPNSNKACILCNGVVTFRTLPELSPAPGHRKLPNCLWIGARDLDSLDGEDDSGEDVIIITIRSKCRLVKTSSDENPQLLKDIEFPGCLTATRRSRFACVADSQAYALLDLENQQKIPLFPISSSSTISSEVGQRQTLGVATSSLSRSTSSAHDSRQESSRQQGHSRATSLGNFVTSIGRRQDDSRRSGALRDNGALSPEPPRVRGPSPSPSLEQSTDKSLPPLPSPAPEPPRPARQEVQQLHPNIVSPLPTEFLLTTGTGPTDPGVGVFVNCDGDVVRGTLEFERYPQSLVVDGGFASPLSSTSQLENEGEGYVLAASMKQLNPPEYGLEIQRWDSTTESRSWLAIPKRTQAHSNASSDHVTGFGLIQTHSTLQMSFNKIENKLKLRRFLLPSSPLNQADEARNTQEDQFAQQFAHTASNLLIWHENSLSWLIRNPLIVRLDAQVERILLDARDSRLDQSNLTRLMAAVRNREAKSEAEFLGLEYIRQKIALILFADLAISQDESTSLVDESLLLEGGADPRVMLSMVPLLHEDIFEGNSGIWIRKGLGDLMDARLSSTKILLDTDEVLERPEEYDIVSLLKRYLHAWRQKKGFGSIADETQVFQTVDAALLHIILHQDQRLSIGPGGSSSLRAELYSVVDQKVDCFDRAIELLEEYHRLYVLSRLYQSRNMRHQVLATWRRILEGERDDGGEFVDGERQIPSYLARTKDPVLFEEYGCWLAKRTPALGVQVFTEDHSKVKLPLERVVEILRVRAPDAVKIYLEHLVFGKKNTQYANELIAFYLDSVLAVLRESADARAILEQSYITYRALAAPRPTYRQFISDNSIEAEWWHDRLRLLELLGGSHGAAAFTYDVPTVLERIEPFEEALIPESIILEGRQGRHTQALHLLTHGLGDYHTAINYCLLGGASIFHPTTTTFSSTASTRSTSPPLPSPSRADQRALFEHLLTEFLKLESPDTRLECTTELLTRFAPWFDVATVLRQIPDTWPVEVLCAFLSSALRNLVHEGTQAAIVKALSGVENLRVSQEFIEKCASMGPHVVAAVDTPDSMA